MERWRSLLFVPGHRPDRFAKALQAGADAVIIDLEDAVAPPDKAAARDAVKQWLGASRPVLLRINGSETPWFDEDLELAGAVGVLGVMLPKAERASQVESVMAAGARWVLPLIESAAGFAALAEVAATPGVNRLAFGSMDFQVDLGMRDAHEDEMLWFRSQIVLASRLANLPAPIDGVTASIGDDKRLNDDAARARRLGFAGKLCIHPSQVPGVHAGFTPGAAELAWAQRVLAAAEAAHGAAVQVDGKMVDRPVILRAEAVVRDADQALGL